MGVSSNKHGAGGAVTGHFDGMSLLPVANGQCALRSSYLWYRKLLLMMTSLISRSWFGSGTLLVLPKPSMPWLRSLCSSSIYFSPDQLMVLILRRNTCAEGERRNNVAVNVDELCSCSQNFTY
ncbi:hypothetical protein VFPPC_16918 [Pochonia chlamydosporia 170]|uniref:Uncharacterized protein n=1 Tax=Pochonia chlamydosporia 170 TaxID=1380566 RepID=A0A179F0M7_METCM|nr:hypothetical protein VFPPC_16918 [Pochonia chlamydosporia 170]OAQ59015.1 hypothetical protein VFPPC_16918 [Pochonia chlamydosporia 170]